MSGSERTSRTLPFSLLVRPSSPNLIVPTTPGSPDFTFSTCCPLVILITLKDGPSTCLRLENFVSSEADDNAIDQYVPISLMPVFNFKNKLLSSSCYEGMEKDNFSIDFGDYEVMDSNFGQSIRLSKQVKNKTYRPWRNFAIIKFVGKFYVCVNWRSNACGI